MEAPELVKLERIALNLPCEHIEMERAPGSHGEIYFAYGLDPHDNYVGIWGCHGIAGGPVEFKPEATRDQVRQVLVNTAEEAACQLFGAGLVNGG